MYFIDLYMSEYWNMYIVYILVIAQNSGNGAVVESSYIYIL